MPWQSLSLSSYVNGNHRIRRGRIRYKERTVIVAARPPRGQDSKDPSPSRGRSYTLSHIRIILSAVSITSRSGVTGCFTQQTARDTPRMQARLAIRTVVHNKRFVYPLQAANDNVNTNGSLNRRTAAAYLWGPPCTIRTKSSRIGAIMDATFSRGQMSGNNPCILDLNRLS